MATAEGALQRKERRRLACETPGRVNAAQPGEQASRLRNAWRWKSPTPAQPTQARRLLSMLALWGRLRACVLCFAERLMAMARLALWGATLAKITTSCTTTQARRLRSLLCRAPKGDGHASAVGATLAKITTACTTDAGETPAFHASAVGATPGLRSLLCRAPNGDGLAAPWGRLPQKKSKFNRLI